MLPRSCAGAGSYKPEYLACENAPARVRRWRARMRRSGCAAQRTRAYKRRGAADARAHARRPRACVPAAYARALARCKRGGGPAATRGEAGGEGHARACAAAPLRQRQGDTRSRTRLAAVFASNFLARFARLAAERASIAPTTHAAWRSYRSLTDMVLGWWWSYSLGHRSVLLKMNIALV